MQWRVYSSQHRGTHTSPDPPPAPGGTLHADGEATPRRPLLFVAMLEGLMRRGTWLDYEASRVASPPREAGAPSRRGQPAAGGGVAGSRRRGRVPAPAKPNQRGQCTPPQPPLPPPRTERGRGCGAAASGVDGPSGDRLPVRVTRPRQPPFMSRRCGAFSGGPHGDARTVQGCGSGDGSAIPIARRVSGGGPRGLRQWGGCASCHA